MTGPTDFHLQPAPGASAPDGPLAGVRVLVTRPAWPAARTAARLASLGAVPLVFPTLLIAPPADPAAVATLEAARARLAAFDAAIFVSPSAVEMFLAPYGAQPLALPARLALYAPGPGTAEALAQVGAEDVTIPEDERYDAQGLLALPSLGPEAIAGRRILIVRGERGRNDLPDTLLARGAQVEVIAAYRSEAPATPPDGLLELLDRRSIDAISVMSSEAATNLVALVAPPRREALLALPLYASHPRIAETARTLGFSEVITTQAGDAGLIAALLMRHEH